MSYFKDKIVPILIGAVITAFTALVASIFSDFIPAASPFFDKLPASLYLKLVLFLIILLITTAVLVFVFYERSKEFKPFKQKGKYMGFDWVADIKEYDPVRGWDIWVNFICPVHGIYLGSKDANVPECAYHVLWCRHCDKEYTFKVAGDVVHLEEIKKVIEDEIISKLRIKLRS